jgi:NYN domain-containing protein
LKTSVYIDGFNLYYGAVKGTPFKWLNPFTLCNLLLPGHAIHKIRYSTARIQARPHDPDAPTRQQIYLRALRTIPCLEIHFGQFLTHPVWMPEANSKSTPPQSVRVLKTEEKGSDVNLASHLLMDGFRKAFEVAVLITNDSDLFEPIRMVRSELNLKVGLLNPSAHASRVLLPPTVNFMKTIRRGILAASQFSDVLSDANGTFQKPKTW